MAEEKVPSKKCLDDYRNFENVQNVPMRSLMSEIPVVVPENRCNVREMASGDYRGYNFEAERMDRRIVYEKDAMGMATHRKSKDDLI